MLLIRGTIKLIISKTRNTKNKIFAMPADAPAMPPNPSTAAINALIKNVRAQPHMVHLAFRDGLDVSRRGGALHAVDSLEINAIVVPNITFVDSARFKHF